MKNVILLLSFFLSINFNWAQNNNRVEVSGKVIVDTNDVEGLTISNKTSNRIAVTDMDGTFTIRVALNDKIEISALQFETTYVVVTKEIVASKQLTVFLYERLNTLDEVVVLPFSLTGSLETDLSKVRTYNPEFESIYFGDLASKEHHYTDVQYKKVENTILRQGRFYNGVDLVKINNWLIKPMFNSNKKVRKQENIHYAQLKDAYTKDFISTHFNIPENKVSDFVAFAERNNTDDSLFKDGKDIELIEYLVNQSKLYLESETEKN